MENFGESVWHRSRSSSSFSSCFTSQNVPHFEFVVIGGGFCGVSAAYHLKKEQPSSSVLLLERDSIGWGSSGRNSGNFGYDTGDQKQSEKQTWFHEQAARVVEEIITNEGLECGLRQTSYLLSAPPHAPHLLHSKFQNLDHLSDSASIVDPDHVQTLTGVNKGQYSGAVYVKNKALSFNPCIYLNALASLLHETLGCMVCENTEVTEIKHEKSESGDEVVQLTIRKRSKNQDNAAVQFVTANKVIVATNGYTMRTLNMLKDRLYACHLFALATPKLSPDTISSLGDFGKGKVFILDPPAGGWRTWYMSDDSRLVVRGKEAYLWNSGIDLDINNYTHEKKNLMQDIFKAYPQIKQDPNLDDDWIFWSGLVSMAGSEVNTVFGKHPHMPNVLYAVGFMAHGIATATMAGKLLAELATKGEKSTMSEELQYACSHWCNFPKPLKEPHHYYKRLKRNFLVQHAKKIALFWALCKYFLVPITLLLLYFCFCYQSK